MLVVMYRFEDLIKIVDLITAATPASILPIRTLKLSTFRFFFLMKIYNAAYENHRSINVCQYTKTKSTDAHTPRNPPPSPH